MKSLWSQFESAVDSRNSLSIHLLFRETTKLIVIVNPFWINYLFYEFTTHQKSFSRIHFFIRFHKHLRSFSRINYESAMYLENSVSVARIHSETNFCERLAWMSYLLPYPRNELSFRIHYLFLEFTVNLLSFSLIWFESTMFLANSL